MPGNLHVPRQTYFPAYPVYSSVDHNFQVSKLCLSVILLSCPPRLWDSLYADSGNEVGLRLPEMSEEPAQGKLPTAGIRSSFFTGLATMGQCSRIPSGVR